MIEKDVMEHVAECLGQRVAPQARLTSAKNKVYRVNMSARAQVEAFLKAVLPFTVGEKKRGEILKLLAVCEQYNKWVAEGGRQKAAQHAARTKAKRTKVTRKSPK